MPANTTHTDSAIAQIKTAEAAFCQYAKDHGVTEAFVQFADEDGVIMRGEKIIKGKAAIRAYYEGLSVTIISLVWSPDFIEASQSGDMGYTYGPYEMVYTPPDGEEATIKGIFHTVWKKQPDDSWRYVFD